MHRVFSIKYFEVPHIFLQNKKNLRDLHDHRPASGMTTSSSTKYLETLAFAECWRLPSLKLTVTVRTPKMDGWKTIVSFWGPAYFQGLLLLVSWRVDQMFNHVLNVSSKMD